MKIAAFTLERNQVFDVIRNLKQLVKIYDNPKIAGRYIEARILLNSEMCVTIKLDRSKDETFIRRNNKHH